MVARCVEPELLDELPPDDPSAQGSRRDLLRLNAWMGHSRILARELEDREPSPARSDYPSPAQRAGDGSRSGQSPHVRQIVELGAGDGTFLLSVARRLSSSWRGTTAVLVDRHGIVSPETQQDFEAQGWRTEVIEADVFDWLTRPTVGFCDAVVANLFLHHFPAAQLTRLLAETARLAKTFIAIEPLRAAWPLTCSRMVWMIGCNRVTQNDAPTSVRAGFAGTELTRHWPADGSWSLQERSVGWFSHMFIARRSEPVK
jgi:hypothetical protein